MNLKVLRRFQSDLTLYQKVDHSVMAAFALACVLVDRSKIVRDLAERLGEDPSPARDGRHRLFPLRTLALLAVTAGICGLPMHIASLQRVGAKLPPKRQRALGIRRPAMGWDHKQIHTTKHGTKEVFVDRTTYERRLHQVADSLEMSANFAPDGTGPEVLAANAAALHSVVHAVLAASRVGTIKDGIVTIDSSPVQAYVDQSTDAEDIPDSNDPDAGLHYKKKRTIGYRVHVVTAIMVTDDGDEYPAVIGYQVAPANRKEWEDGANLIVRLKDDGADIRRVVADRGYTRSGFFRILADNDIEWIYEPFKNQLGPSGTLPGSGAVAIEGDAYCPAIPERLRNIGRVPRRRSFSSKAAYLKALDIYERLNAAREEYLVDDAGETSAGNPRGTCPVRRHKDRDCTRHPVKPEKTPHNGWPKQAGAFMVLPTVDTPMAAICTQGTVTFYLKDFHVPPQALRYGSLEWRAQFALYRNLAEGLFGWAKQDNGDQPIWANNSCRLRGLTRVSLMYGLWLTHFNLRQLGLLPHAEEQPLLTMQASDRFDLPDQDPDEYDTGLPDDWFDDPTPIPQA